MQQLLFWASCQFQVPTIFYLWTAECVLKQYQFKHWCTRTILVPRVCRFLATGRLQIKPSGSGDENAHVPTPRYGQYLTYAHNHISRKRGNHGQLFCPYWGRISPVEKARVFLLSANVMFPAMFWHAGPTTSNVKWTWRILFASSVTEETSSRYNVLSVEYFFD